MIPINEYITRCCYEYDPRGNRTTKVSGQDLDFNPVSYGYDEWDRLTQVTTEEDGEVTYRYNGDDLLYERVANGQTTRYYWDGDRLLAEAAVNGSQVTPKVSYIYGNELLVQIDAAILSRSHYLLNGHQDVVELRDNAGNVQNSYTYDIWGKPLTETETVYNPFRYSSEFWDGTTSLQYLRARWYDSQVGRFITEDTYEGQIDNPLTLNLYTYVENNPLTSVDPTGHWCTATVGSKAYSHPGSCNDGGDSQRKSGAGYTRDEVHNGEWYYDDNGNVKQYFNPGAPHISDPSGLSQDIIGCFTDVACFPETGLITKAPNLIDKAVSGAKSLWSLGKSLFGKGTGNAFQWTGKNFSQMGKNMSPNEMISNLEKSGWTKTIEPDGKKSGPATILTDPSTGTKVRIHAVPGGGTPYFRVQNKGGGYLDDNGVFPSNATKQELRDATHFYFEK